MSVAMTKKELASLAGYTYRRLYDIDRLLPEDKKLFVKAVDEKGNKAERYDAATFVQRWVDYRVGEDGGTNKDLDRVRTEHEKIKTRKTELEVAKMEGTVVPIDQVRAEWARIAHTAMQAMMTLPGKLAPRLIEMENAEAIGGIIEQEVRAALTALSETGAEGAQEAAKAEEGGEDDEPEHD